MISSITAGTTAVHPWMLRSPRLLLLLALLATACDRTSSGPTQPAAAEPAGPQPTFGTAQHDEARAVYVRGSFIYVAGITEGSLDGPNRGRSDAFVRRYHSEGEVLWADQFGTNAADYAAGVAADAAGNVYVTGSTDGSLAGSRGASDAFIRKYNSSGKLLWTRQFGTEQDDYADAVGVDGSGNVYVVGSTFGSMQGANQGRLDVFVRKFNPDGGVLWTRQFGTSSHERAQGVAVEGLGNVYVVGYTDGTLQGTSAGGIDAFIRRYNADGTVAWTRQFGTRFDDLAHAVALDGTGAAIIAGETGANLEGTGSGGIDAFVRKYSSAGGLVATRQFGTPEADLAVTVAVDPDDSYYVAGLTRGSLSGASAGWYDAFVRKYDSSNTHRWTRQFGTPAADRAYGVAAGSSSAIYLAGSTGGALMGFSSGGVDAFLRRLNANGGTVWTDQ
jgi:hypothetical protein